MGTFISVGVLTVEDVADPTSRPRVAWPNLVNLTTNSMEIEDWHPGNPQRPFNARGWDAWRSSPLVLAILAYCRVPAHVDRDVFCQITDELMHLITVLHENVRHLAHTSNEFDRGTWLFYWANRARTEFGDQAYIGFC